MARRRSRSASRLSQRAPDLVVLRRPVLRPLQLLEDRRLHHPARVRPARAFFGKARIVVRKPSGLAARFDALTHRVAFDIPKRVAICVRRRERREVLIAKGVGGSRRSKRRNAWSNVSC